MEKFTELIHFLEEDIPFNKALGLKVVKMEEGFARLKIPFQSMLIGDKRRPAIHGGVTSMLADTCGGAAVWSYFTREDGISTVDLRVDYLNPAPECDLICESTVQRLGNRVAVVHSKVFAEENPEVVLAEGRAVYNIKSKGALQRG